MSTDERGLSESLQWAVLLPVVMLTVLGIIQSGIWLHGRSVAANAALAGAEAQALSGAGGGTGARVAREVAEHGGLREVQVQVGGGRDVSVAVTARVDTFFDLGRSRVIAHAEMPRELP
ncbi:TadE-like protein [Luteococcus japonicus]|uniref:TadE-like protein n=1 Tax=Luteococcus japonicus TaxID=33984 RepID=A0A3N1ZVL9_9ACTN|nr:TadE/TadG family type IV pilus assembly protein [Luteococcus japonicus]ROR54890.1 TadE-like protein [Luteococcus japonicus]